MAHIITTVVDHRTYYTYTSLKYASIYAGLFILFYNYISRYQTLKMQQFYSRAAVSLSKILGHNAIVVISYRRFSYLQEEVIQETFPAG